MVGRVQKQQREFVRRRQHGVEPERQGALARVVAEVPVVAQDCTDVRVSREQPGVHQLAAVHGVPGTQGSIDRIGVLGRACRQRVVGDAALPALLHHNGVDDHGSQRVASASSWRRVSRSSMRRSKHCFANTPISISTILSQLACLGTK